MVIIILYVVFNWIFSKSNRVDIIIPISHLRKNWNLEILSNLFKILYLKNKALERSPGDHYSILSVIDKDYSLLLPPSTPHPSQDMYGSESIYKVMSVYLVTRTLGIGSKCLVIKSFQWFLSAVMQINNLLVIRKLNKRVWVVWGKSNTIVRAKQLEMLLGTW